MKNLLLICSCFIQLLLLAQPSGYSFGKQLLVNASQVAGSTDLTDFQMLVSFTDADLRTIPNGGHVNHPFGYDIIFTTGDCNTILDHQIERYTASTGEYIAWVKIPTLYATTNTNIHMYYGNAIVNTDPSTTNTWSANHGAVYHMNQVPNASSPQLIDYSANTNSGTANGSMTASDLVSGKIGYGIDFDGSNDYFDCGASATTVPTGDLTVSAWLYSRAASGHIINRGGGWSDPGYSLFHLSNNIRIELQRSGEKDIVDNGISNNTWHYVALTYNYTSKTIKCFIDGVQQGSTGNHTGPIGTPVENLNIGRKQKNGYYFNGIIDESRVIKLDRSNNWILTEYNNQNTPNTFYTKSAEYSAGGLCFTLPIDLIDFKAELIKQKEIYLNWRTASELNNDYFLVEKSMDGQNWLWVEKIEGAGNSSEEIVYQTVDYINENFSTLYYRLTQVDFDGSSTTSKTISVAIPFEEYNSSIYPNPFENNVTINTTAGAKLCIINIGGNIVYQTYLERNQNQINLDFLPKGFYIFLVGNEYFKVNKH